MNRIRVDIECGHHVLNSICSQVEIEEVSASAEIATRLADQLRTLGFEVTYSLLIDDKRLTSTVSIADHIREISCHAHGLEFDRVMLESSLVELFPDLIESIRIDGKKRLRKEAERWQGTHNGYLACSQDVAIWHFLRLGLTRSRPRLWLKGGDTDQAENAQEAYTTVCISVLPRRLSAFEERAQRDILQHVSGYRSENVHQLYFGFGDTALEREEKISSVVRRITQIAARQVWLNDPPAVFSRATSLPSFILNGTGKSLSDKRFVVVGAGIIGLSTAIRLSLSDARVEVISSPKFAMVSPTACALWLPTCLNKADDHFGCDSSLEAVARDSWKWYQWLLSEFGSSAGMRPVVNHEYMKSGQGDPPLWLQDLFPFSHLSPRVLKWRGVTYDRVWKFRTIVIDMSRYMSWLRGWAESLGVVFDDRHLESLSEAFSTRTSAVINCSGLGAKQLAHDSSVRPVRGQVLFLETTNGAGTDTMDSVGIGEYCLIPRITDIALGSLIEDNSGSSSPEPKYSQKSEEKLRAALDSLVDLCGVNRSSLEFCGRSAVGLRPSRKNGYRVEAKQEKGGLVIHNYGHGGGGVTLAWGCANQVVHLAASSLGTMGDITSPSNSGIVTGVPTKVPG